MKSVGGGDTLEVQLLFSVILITQQPSNAWFLMCGVHHNLCSLWSQSHTNVHKVEPMDYLQNPTTLFPSVLPHYCTVNSQVMWARGHILPFHGCIFILCYCYQHSPAEPVDNCVKPQPFNFSFCTSAAEWLFWNTVLLKLFLFSQKLKWTYDLVSLHTIWSSLFIIYSYYKIKLQMKLSLIKKIRLQKFWDSTFTILIP